MNQDVWWLTCISPSMSFVFDCAGLIGVEICGMKLSSFEQTDWKLGC
jgi:hypothetical protein